MCRRGTREKQGGATCIGTVSRQAWRGGGEGGGKIARAGVLEVGCLRLWHKSSMALCTVYFVQIDASGGVSDHVSIAEGCIPSHRLSSTAADDRTER